jgi:hypothetical protein
MKKLLAVAAMKNVIAAAGGSYHVCTSRGTDGKGPGTCWDYPAPPQMGGQPTFSPPAPGIPTVIGILFAQGAPEFAFWSTFLKPHVVDAAV